MTTFLVVFVLIVLAAARVTRLVTHDKITEPVRKRLVDKIGADSKTAYLVHCPVCTAIWVAAPAAALSWFVGHAPEALHVPWWAGIPTLWLAIAYTASTIVTREAD